jgi:hypothetical protein
VSDNFIIDIFVHKMTTSIFGAVAWDRTRVAHVTGVNTYHYTTTTRSITSGNYYY